SVANLIAAGEVIQRPASVVKELVENSIDAGATEVQLIVKDAGRTLIQVIDNGCGMSPTDARMAFERHATSKIVKAEDLFTLMTMGFRGEALPTVAAVADVDLRSMPHDENIGTRLIITDNKVESQSPEACVPGTNIMVKNIFNRLPARRKFLKRDAVELSHIVHEFERLALVNPSVAFTLMHNGTVMHKLGKAPLKQRIADLFGKSVGHQLIPVEADTSLIKITGFVGLPEHARRRNALQYFFVNGRNMRHPYFHRAVMQCYDNLISPEAHPVYFLNFEVDPTTIDVNISPTKNEVKFENEQAIWQILTASIRESLGRYNAAPAIDFDQENAPEIPAFDPLNNKGNATIEHDPSFNPFTSPYRSELGGLSGSVINNVAPAAGVRMSTPRDRGANQLSNWDKLYADFQREAEVEPIHTASSALNEVDNAQLELDDSGMPVTLLQLRSRYIVSPSSTGLMIVDQHRAHERVLYEKYLAMVESGTMSTQRLIFPDSVELTMSQSIMLESILDQVSEMGFDLSPLGNNAWAINGQPAVLEGNPKEALLSIVDDFSTTGIDPSQDLYSRVAQSMARASAIRPGQALAQEEMERLLSDLLKLPTPNYTPDGRTVISIIPITEISRLFE
ncbi:MAG: DNA mismatch repair endonuclease MutL, partial [Muribaculaceae bacterium]|nr:DNA mismatch repair endonuclease MutL [Muribaculaceae bacterium]